jgi:hypothetical protein
MLHKRAEQQGERLLSHGMKLSHVSKKADLGLAEEKVGIEKRIEVLKQGLFGVLFVMSKDSTMHHGWHMVLVFFHFFQVCQHDWVMLKS